MATTQSTMTSKGQVTVPRQIRELLGLHTGDKLVWSTREDGVVEIRKVPKRTLDDFVGMLGDAPRHFTIEELDDSLRERFAADRSS